MKKYCKDCKKEIKRYDAKRCSHCAKLGELSPVYKGYDKLFTKELIEKEYADKSVCDIAKKYKVSQSCMYRIFEDYEIKRRKCNSFGKLASGFKHGKCTTSLPKYCSCGKKLSNNPKAKMCRICRNRLIAKDPIIQARRIAGIKRRYVIDPNYKLNRSGRNSSSFGKISNHSKGSYYNNIWMRSSYEILFAKWLDKQNIKWLYESKMFDLGNTTYRPDFYLPEFNLYIEVKGWWRDDAKIKFDLFKQKYCGERIKIVDKLELQSIGVLK